jgi:MFS transporter, AAHS family, 4-hydroxybenzoate transporter
MLRRVRREVVMGNRAAGASPKPIGQSRISVLQVRALLFCFLLNMIDGSDVLVVSYAAPALARDWGVTAPALGMLFSAGLAGMTLGAALIAPLADRIGRKTMILVALCIVTVGMGASAFAPGLGALAALRIFVGLGIGVMLASVTSLAAEFAPPRYQALSITFAIAGYPLGAVATGIVAAIVIPPFGWSGLFIVASLVSFVTLPLALLFLPESLDFLVARQPRGALTRVNLLRSGMGLTSLRELPPKSTSLLNRPTLGTLFSARFRRSTLLLWGAFFTTFMTLYFLTSWIPKIAVDAGLPVTDAILAGALFNLGACVGVLVLGLLATGVALTRVIAFFFVLGPAVMVVFAYYHQPTAVLFAEIFLLGFLIQGGFSGLYAVAARIYPVAVRTTGVGWALGAGRLGAVLGPAIGGLTIGWGVGLAGNFLLFAVPIVVAGLFLLRIGEPSEDAAT